MNALWIILFAAACVSADSELEKKEETCYMVAGSSLRQRREQIDDYLKESGKKLNPTKLAQKLIEDSFYHCLEVINEDEIGLRRLNIMTDFEKHKHLVDVSFEVYDNDKQLELSPKFIATRKDLSDRMLRKHRKDL
jgi:hypothetical protein